MSIDVASAAVVGGYLVDLDDRKDSYWEQDSSVFTYFLKLTITSKSLLENREAFSRWQSLS